MPDLHCCCTSKTRNLQLNKKPNKIKQKIKIKQETLFPLISEKKDIVSVDLVLRF